MKSVMTAASYWVNWLANRLMKAALWAGMVLCVVMTVAALGQVASRTTNLFSFDSSEEIALFSMCWMAMLGSAVALRQGRHLGVRLLVEKLPAGVYDRCLAPIVQLAMLAFFLVVTVKGWEFAMRGSFQESPSLELPMVYPYLCLPVGGALMALSVIADMLQDRFPTCEGSTASIASTTTENIAALEAEQHEEFDPFAKGGTRQ